MLSQSQFLSFLFISDFVGQTSDAATGAASIIVNDAGKYFCFEDPESSLSWRNDLVHTQSSGRTHCEPMHSALPLAHHC